MSQAFGTNIYILLARSPGNWTRCDKGGDIVSHCQRVSLHMKQEARFAVLDLLRIVHYILQLTDTALVILVNSVAR